MMYLGVDPGLGGAIALLDSYGELVEVHDMPVVDKRVSQALLSDLVMTMDIDIHDALTAVIEQVSAFPKQGVAGVFKFGVSYGIVLGVIAGYRINTVHVTSTKWKHDMRLSKDKEVSRRRALDRWPRHAERFSLKKHEGRAEAALLALWHQERVT